jgi:hypothetical protein
MMHLNVLAPLNTEKLVLDYRLFAYMYVFVYIYICMCLDYAIHVLHSNP